MSTTRARPRVEEWDEGPSHGAEHLYALGQKEQPLRAAIFTVEQLEIHARALAGEHVARKGRGTGRLLGRLAENQRIIALSYEMIAGASAAGRRLAPAAEWLLDNHYLIEEQIRLAREHLPRGFARQLPVLQDGEMAGYPRVYDSALQLISHLDGKVDAETLWRFIAAYQSVTPLRLGELWAVPIMVRLSLIENLRRVSVSMTWRRSHRDMALKWAGRINDASEKKDGEVVLLLADMLRENPPLSTAFVAEFTQALQGRGPAVVFVLSWLEQKLADQGQTIDQIVAAESQSQAADQVSIANSIASLRFVGAHDWHEFVEGQSRTEAILRTDPAGMYAKMDFATRDMYRHAVEQFSRDRAISEEKVAGSAIEMATAQATNDIEKHVGFWLVDAGWKRLTNVLKGRRAEATHLRDQPRVARRLALYLLAAAALTVLLTAELFRLGEHSGIAWRIIAGALALLAMSQPALALVNWVISILRVPRALPRMDFSTGIPDSQRTIVAVPAMLTSADRVTKLIEDIELRHLGNRDPNLWFALLSDFSDAPTETTDGDQELLDQAEQGIGELNQRYCADRTDRFYLLHRPRLYDDREGVWMARERKRGKLEDFGAVLRGKGRSCFSAIVGDAEKLTTVMNVIVLDSDTDLPWGSGSKLVGTLAHPLNQPVLDAANQLRRGYVILQPRVNVTLSSAKASRYARLMAGEVGIDPYTRVVSDLYQDLFSNASFIGKGIYQVDAFRSLLDGRFAPNSILSHDLLESCYARTALVSDVELLEDYPSQYLADINRRHRWIRGDWQIAPFLGRTVLDGEFHRRPSGVGPLGRWKIFDNLRRSLVPPALLLTFVLGWALGVRPLGWTLSILAAWVLPEILPAIRDLLRRPRDVPWAVHWASLLVATRDRLTRLALMLVFLPYEAVAGLDAIVRTLWRMLVSRRLLLQWQTALMAEHSAARELAPIALQMWPAMAVGALGIVLLELMSPASLRAAAPILALWLMSPIAAWWMSRPIVWLERPLNERQQHFLGTVARLTWRFFEDFVGPEDNWLAPDNFQEHPTPRIAHRTSPTNIGLSLLANLSAWDMGYLTAGQLLDRTGSMLDSMEQLERFRGHFYNWYDTRAHKAISPLYISTVDSGNLIGHLCIMRQGLLEWLERPVLPGFRGLSDTLAVLEMQLRPKDGASSARPVYDDTPLQLITRLLARPPVGLRASAAWLSDVCQATFLLAASVHTDAAPEASWWAHALDRQAKSLREELELLAPWVASPYETEAGDGEILSKLDKAATAGELAEMARESTGAKGKLAQWLLQCQTQISQRHQRAEELARRCWELAQADFQFLFDKGRKLLIIGYNVAERRADNSHYDLLASESRLGSYATIAMGQLPVDHWFALGRLLTSTRGKPALVSWSGSMFEYLMPLLVMPNFNRTLLDETYRVVVRRQMDHGKRQGLPWGISESCYNLTDADGNYQYRAFGVPGLGLQRGLSHDLVIAPYATAMALLVDADASCRNLQRMADQQYLGRYGFFESIDYTPTRLPEGEHEVVIRAFMAHHQGMSLLALSQILGRREMQQRFSRIQSFRAAELLLQERVPKAAGIIFPHAHEVVVSRQAGAAGPESEMRVVSNPATPTPEVHLLSNGRYHVMVSAAGGGYSRWNEIAVNRWREDPTCDGWGIFCYVSQGPGRYWSTSYQPVRTAGRNYHAVFTQGRAEFRRQDHRIETHTEIAVSPEDDLEIRRVTLTNRSGLGRSLSLTSYFEPVGSPAAPDNSHRVFSNLFVQTELDAAKSAVLVSRRPRSVDEKPSWLFCLMISATESVGQCTFETDRARFVGRGRTAADPIAMEAADDLSNTSGPVLEPCVAIRRNVNLPADAAARIDLIIGAAPTREAALAMIDRYQDFRMADRVFELASAHSKVVLGHLGGTEALAQQFAHMASAAIYPSEAHRAPANILRRNLKGQSGLWGYGISGDHPIVLLRVGDTENLRLVRDLLMAHAYWRMKGLTTDLLIWNEDASGYRQKLNDQIMAMIAAGTEAHLIDKPGGIFVRPVDQVAEDDRILMQTAARLVLSAEEGTLEEQLDRRRRLMAAAPTPPALVPRLTAPSFGEERPMTPRQDLTFSNGTGGFTRDGREYVVNIAADSPAPAPWSNVIANPRMGTVVSESGGAYTWFENAQLYRLTPWYNDPVSDRSGEALYVRDDRSGRFFSTTPLPRAGKGQYVSRHGFGYSIFEHREEGLETQLTQYVDVKAPVKFLALKLKNVSGQSRSISIFAFVEWVLGDLPQKNGMFVVTELDPRTGALVARNNYGPDFGNCMAFLDCSQPLRSVTGDRKEFLGRNGDMASPAAMRFRRLSGRVGAGLDPCAGMQTAIEMAPGEEREIVFVIGAGRDREEALSLIQRYRGAGTARVALEEVWKFWNERLGILYVETPDLALNVITNGWLPYQALSCRMWGRSGYYQSGGAWGFRDQLQDCVALLHEAPELVREHVLRCAGRQFPEGDVQHWWHPPTGRGVRTTCSDDYLWLPYAVCRYVNFTRDVGVLDEKVNFIGARVLREGEESVYDLPARLEESASLYEHCVRAIRHGFRFGAHGLPLMGSGDWNDGMNLVGHAGKGESVWLAFFMHHVLTQFAQLAKERGDEKFAQECLGVCRDLAAHIDESAWDGKWYRRAYFDNGDPLGSSQNAECQIDLLPQCWSVIAGCSDPNRSKQAMESLWERLVRKDLGVIQLLDPPFDQSNLEPGYIKGYLPGVRENGGQYTHAAVWAAMGFALAGQAERAAELVKMLNPINHAQNSDQVGRYKVEPYVIAADVYTSKLHPGRGGWTWYTGSAGWFYRLVHEVMLGIDRRGDTMTILPRLPKSWTNFKVHYRYYQTFYHMTFTRSPDVTGPAKITVDQQGPADEVLKLINDRREHTVEVLFG